jgi:hypothetical protein
VVVTPNKEILVQPIYGWGWSDNGSSDLLPVPEPFMVEVAQSVETVRGKEMRVLRGIANAPDHEFHGFSVKLSPRHDPWVGHVNIELHSGEGRLLVGFATTDIASFE